MSNKNKSPFDQFWSFGSQEREEPKQEQEDPSVDWSDLMQEMSKTWKSVSPMVKPMIDKFKK